MAHRAAEEVFGADVDARPADQPGQRQAGHRVQDRGHHVAPIWFRFTRTPTTPDATGLAPTTWNRRPTPCTGARR